jgi:hypothetical protein
VRREVALGICVHRLSGGIAIHSPPRRAVLPKRLRRVCKLSLAEPEYDSAAEPEIVLPVVESIGDLGEEILGLYGTNREVL